MLLLVTYQSQIGGSALISAIIEGENIDKDAEYVSASLPGSRSLPIFR
jgi:hypothetical protein